MGDSWEGSSFEECVCLNLHLLCNFCGKYTRIDKSREITPKIKELYLSYWLRPIEMNPKFAPQTICTSCHANISKGI